MLFTLNGIKITRIPHRAEYETWKSRMTPEAFDAIFDELNSRVSGAAVHTSS